MQSIARTRYSGPCKRHSEHKRKPMRTRNFNGNKNIAGTVISERRKVLGMKQKDLLTRLQVRGVDLNISALSKIEGGQRMISDIELAALSDALGITADELLKGSGFKLN